MRKALIVAMSRNRVIGRNNTLPWHLPEDLKYFREVTMGKPVIMGRKTWESIGRALPGRLNIVVSSADDLSLPAGVVHEKDLEAAFRRAEAQAILDGADEVMVIGGGQIYEAVLPQMDRLYITQVHAEVEGDAFFPEISLEAWEEVGREDFSASDQNPYDYSFVVFQRPAG